MLAYVFERSEQCYDKQQSCTTEDNVLPHGDAVCDVVRNEGADNKGEDDPAFGNLALVQRS